VAGLTLLALPQHLQSHPAPDRARSPGVRTCPSLTTGIRTRPTAHLLCAERECLRWETIATASDEIRASRGRIGSRLFRRGSGGVASRDTAAPARNLTEHDGGVASPEWGHGTSHRAPRLALDQPNIRSRNNLGNKLRKTEHNPETENPMNPGLLAPQIPSLGGCGPGGRGFESRRSPLRKGRISADFGQSRPCKDACWGPIGVQLLHSTRSRQHGASVRERQRCRPV
jgi:hypothetical protein